MEFLEVPYIHPVLLADQVVVLSMRPCWALARFEVSGIASPRNPKAIAELEAEIFAYLQ